jgi:CBS domain containing-hemolysin-like protein
MATALIFILFSLVAGAILTALKRALQCYNILKIEVDKKQGRKYAETVEQLQENKKEFLYSAGIARTLFILVFAVASATVFWPLLLHSFQGREWVAIILLVSGISIAVLVISELIPFLIATMYPGAVLENFYWFALVVKKIFSQGLVKYSKGEKTADIVKKEKETEQDLEREDSKEIEIFQRALDFPDVILRECLIPRTEICAVEESASYQEIVTLFVDTNYSRIIVFKENIDRITGYVHSKDLFAGERQVKEIIRQIDFFPETARAKEVLAILTKNKRSIAVVLDEFGGTAGIVTLEDLIEEIFGEISDELDSDDLIDKELPGGEYLFSGRIEVKFINRKYNLGLPESEEYETLSGFITYYNENIPSEGDVVRYGNIQFTILKTSSNRVESVSLRIVEE